MIADENGGAQTPFWIPVSDRLPRYDIHGDKLSNMYLCYHVSDCFSWYQVDWWDGVKFAFKRDGKNDHVTHWMPLPPPPEDTNAWRNMEWQKSG